MTEQSEETKLHWIRVKHKDSNEAFVDPMADIKTVVQQAFKEAPYLINLQEPEKAERLRQILKVFCTKLEESSESLDDILTEFLAVVRRDMQDITVDLVFGFALYILSTFALHMRRDGAINKAQNTAFNSTAALLTLYSIFPEVKKCALSDITDKNIRDDVENFVKAYKPSPIVNAICFEDTDNRMTIKDIKDVVALAFGATGEQSWNAVAEACDKIVRDEVGTETQQVAAALAYPTYDKPYYEAESDNAGNFANP